MDLFLDWIDADWLTDSNVIRHLIISVLVILFLMMGRWLIMRAVKSQTKDVTYLYKWSKGSTYVSVAIGLPVILMIWISEVGSVGTFLGLVSAGLAVALSDTLINIAGWLFIVGKRPFTVGDRIEVDGSAGDVIDVSLFQFTILEIGNWVDSDQSTGRIIHIPNRFAFNKALANYTQSFGFIWLEAHVLITFESDWKKMKETLMKISETEVDTLGDKAQRSVRESASRYMIFYRKLTPMVYTSVKDSGVQITLRYLCEPRKRRGTEARVWEAILEAIDADPSLELAYPTWRIYHRGEEGATPTGPTGPSGPTGPAGPSG
ncbi:MAG: mechanosensitive ion channel domain-containing protein, partial [Rhodothermia bacterium]